MNQKLSDQAKPSTLRYKKAAERLDRMFAHSGECRYCGGIVKMSRDQTTLNLLPDKCWCLQCGQRYYMQIDDLKAWESEQWRQKAEAGY